MLLQWLLALHLRQAVRGLRRNPTFTTAVLLTLALAIGANTAVFSVMNGVLINPLPYPQPESLISVLTTRTSFALVMLGIAASMALVLGLVGIYGVIAYAATRRTREVGIRLTLGAQQREVRGMFVRQGLVLTGIGIAIGLAAAAGVMRLMTSLLFQVSSVDPLTYFLVAMILMTATLLGSYVPARRISRVDPAVAKRAE